MLVAAFAVVVIHALVPHHHHATWYELLQSAPAAEHAHADHAHAADHHPDDCPDQPLDLHHLGTEHQLEHYRQAQTSDHHLDIIAHPAPLPVVWFWARLLQAAPHMARIRGPYDVPPLLRPAYVGPTGCHSPPARV